MGNQQNNELEIDLIELLQEIRKQLPLVILTTLLFAVVAYVYKFMYLPPTYTYTRMVKCPIWVADNRTIPDQELLSHVVIFRTDVGNSAIWKERSRGCLIGVDLIREKNSPTKLIQFQFSGTDPEYIKTVSQQYMETVARRLDDSFAEVTENYFKYRYYRTTNEELQFNNALLGNSNAATGSISYYQALLKDRLEALEKDKPFLKAKVIDASNLEPARVNQRRSVMICAFLGFFLSLGYITCRYLWKQVKQNGVI